jgi:hypothetical protein
VCLDSPAELSGTEKREKKSQWKVESPQKEKNKRRSRPTPPLSLSPPRSLSLHVVNFHPLVPGPWSLEYLAMSSFEADRSAANAVHSKWVVQKFGGTSVGKFALNIIEQVVQCVTPPPVLHAPPFWGSMIPSN